MPVPTAQVTEWMPAEEMESFPSSSSHWCLPSSCPCWWPWESVHITLGDVLSEVAFCGPESVASVDPTSEIPT